MHLQRLSSHPPYRSFFCFLCPLFHTPTLSLTCSLFTLFNLDWHDSKKHVAKVYASIKLIFIINTLRSSDTQDQATTSNSSNIRNCWAVQSVFCHARLGKQIFIPYTLSVSYIFNLLIFYSHLSSCQASKPPAIPLVKTMCQEVFFSDQMSLEFVVPLMLVSAPTCV